MLFYMPPPKELWINFKGEMGSNGQFDEIAIIYFMDQYSIPNGKKWHWIEKHWFRKYCRDLQKNYDEHRRKMECDKERAA